MTTADEKMREEFESLKETALYCKSMGCTYIGDSTVNADAVLAMHKLATQSSKRLKELERQLATITAERDEWRLKATSHIVYVQCEKHMGQPYSVTCISLPPTAYKCPNCEKGE